MIPHFWFRAGIVRVQFWSVVLQFYFVSKPVQKFRVRVRARVRKILILWSADVARGYGGLYLTLSFVGPSYGFPRFFQILVRFWSGLESFLVRFRAVSGPL